MILRKRYMREVTFFKSLYEFHDELQFLEQCLTYKTKAEWLRQIITFQKIRNLEENEVNLKQSFL